MSAARQPPDGTADATGTDSGDAIYRGVIAARARLEGHARRTPVMRSDTLDARLGAQVVFKCENLQRTGAFKFRGAFNALSRLSEAERARGVITYSSGNHGQALALAGRLLDVHVTLVTPVDAPRVKREAAAGYGAELITYDREVTTREAVAGELARERGGVVIPPYDHPDVIAGQGTAAAELSEQAGPLDMLLVPTGGAGLLGGCAVAMSRLQPQCRVIGIEPELADDATRSFRTGTLHTVSNPPTIADGVRTPSLGRHTFPLVRGYVDDMQTVTERAIAEAVQFFTYRMKLVVEPAGALGLAALLSAAVAARGRIGVLVSGGNVDGEVLARLLSGHT